MPCWKPFFAKEIPHHLEGDNERNGISGAKDRPGQNITGIMDTVVNTGKGDRRRHAESRDGKPAFLAIEQEDDHGGGKPIGRMGGRHAAGIGATDARDGIREDDTGARAGNGVFDGVDDEGRGNSRRMPTVAQMSDCLRQVQG